MSVEAIHRLCRRVLYLSLIGLVLTSCSGSEVRRGHEMAQAGKWDEAVSAYRKAVRDKPFDEDLLARLENAKAKAADQHYDVGRAALQEGRITRAAHEFEWAVGYDPERREYHVALTEALRLKEAREQLESAEKLKYIGRMDDALVAYERAARLDPQLMTAYRGITAVTVHQHAAKAVAKTTQPITLRFQQAKLREVFEILARTADVNVVFDKDVRDDPVTIFLKDMPYHNALKLILSTNNLMAHRVASDTILVTPATKQKQAQYQDLMLRTFYLSNAEAKKTVTQLRTMLETKNVTSDEAANAIIIRDSPAKLHLAERVIHSIDRRQPEVMLEVEVLEIDRTKRLQYGLDYQKSASFALAPMEFVDGTPIFSLEALGNLGPTSYLFTFPSAVTLDFFKQESQAKTLASPKVRVVHGEKAAINVGDKQPILLSTTSVLPGQTATGSVPTTSTVTSTEFKDTGVKLTVEPRIHLLGELTLKLNIEVTRVGEKVILQENPEISQFKFGTRTAETTLRLRDGETIVIGGLISEEQRQTEESVPLLGDIPYLGKLLTSTDRETITTEIVLTITPRIVRHMDTLGVENQFYWSGTRTQFSTDRIFAPEPKLVSFLEGRVTPGSVAEPQREPGREAPPTTEGPTTPRGPLREAPPERVPGDALFSQGGGESGGLTTTPGPGVLAIRPSRLLTTVGQEFRVDQTADQVGDLTECLVAVTYDPQLLEFVRAAEGEALSRSPGPSGVTAASNPEVGQVVLHVTRQGSGSVVSGALAGLFFKAKAPGTSILTLTPAKVTGMQGQSISVSVRPASVEVREGS